MSWPSDGATVQCFRFIVRIRQTRSIHTPMITSGMLKTCPVFIPAATILPSLVNSSTHRGANMPTRKRPLRHPWGSAYRRRTASRATHRTRYAVPSYTWTGWRGTESTRSNTNAQTNDVGLPRISEFIRFPSLTHAAASAMPGTARSRTQRNGFPATTLPYSHSIRGIPIIGIPLMLWLYGRVVAGKPFLWVLDRAVPGIALAAACVRLGNLMNSEILGKPTSFVWAFVFERVDSIPRHPVQVYEGTAYLVLCVALLAVRRRYALPQGCLSGLFLVGMFAPRWVLEFTKEGKIVAAGMNTGQVLSIPLVIIGVWMLLVCRMRTMKRKH